MNPADPSFDTPLEIRLTGLYPGADVTLRGRLHDSFGRPFEAAARFFADEAGVIDVATQAPISGSYADADPMGLVWSMTPAGGSAAPPDDRVLPPSTLALTARVGRDVVAETTVDRARLPAGVSRTVVREGGLIGTLFAPDADGLPGVLLLGGSEGGLHEMDAALLAARGYAVLALAYFGMPGVPEALIDIPLEYFRDAISWLRSRPNVDADRIAVMGGSRGAEAALLLGATYPEIGAVVSVVGSGVLTAGIGPGGQLLDKLVDAPTWTLDGKPLPYLPYTVSPRARAMAESGEPFPLGAVFLPSLDDHAAVEAATIQVERIDGAVLLISAGDDRMWPSETLSEVAAKRLSNRDKRHEHEHVSYSSAGHLIAGTPYVPTTELVIPGPGVSFDTGGSPAANAAARADAWSRTTTFLADYL